MALSTLNAPAEQTRIGRAALAPSWVVPVRTTSRALRVARCTPSIRMGANSVVRCFGRPATRAGSPPSGPRAPRHRDRATRASVRLAGRSSASRDTSSYRSRLRRSRVSEPRRGGRVSRRGDQRRHEPADQDERAVKSARAAAVRTSVASGVSAISPRSPRRRRRASAASAARSDAPSDQLYRRGAGPLGHAVEDAVVARDDEPRVGAALLLRFSSTSRDGGARRTGETARGASAGAPRPRGEPRLDADGPRRPLAPRGRGQGPASRSRIRLTRRRHAGRVREVPAGGTASQDAGAATARALRREDRRGAAAGDVSIGAAFDVDREPGRGGRVRCQSPPHIHPRDESVDPRGFVVRRQFEGTPGTRRAHRAHRTTSAPLQQVGEDLFGGVDQVKASERVHGLARQLHVFSAIRGPERHVVGT